MATPPVERLVVKVDEVFNSYLTEEGFIQGRGGGDLETNCEVLRPVSPHKSHVRRGGGAAAVVGGCDSHTRYDEDGEEALSLGGYISFGDSSPSVHTPM